MVSYHSSELAFHRQPRTELRETERSALCDRDVCGVLGASIVDRTLPITEASSFSSMSKGLLWAPLLLKNSPFGLLARLDHTVSR